MCCQRGAGRCDGRRSMARQSTRRRNSASTVRPIDLCSANMLILFSDGLRPSIQKANAPLPRMSSAMIQWKVLAAVLQRVWSLRSGIGFFLVVGWGAFAAADGFDFEPYGDLGADRVAIRCH